MIREVTRIELDKIWPHLGFSYSDPERKKFPRITDQWGGGDTSNVAYSGIGYSRPSSESDNVAQL